MGSATRTTPASFDVVVVGGGSAGCVMAARLAESASRSVLLLEAGPDRRADLPDKFRDGWRICREFDWGYVSEASDGHEPSKLLRTRMLGGTSWVTRYAVRGSPVDFDGWAAQGPEGSGFDDVLPYFRRLEVDADFAACPWHGAEGPLPITRYLDLDLTPAAQAGLDAMTADGFPLVEDHNQPGAVGAGRMPMSGRAGERVTTADAYLPLAGTPPNLIIQANSQVADVVFEDGVARGVRLINGAVISAGHVILSAGAYGSPAILLRSGIGPADELRTLGIPVRADLPGVGRNLADHPSVWVERAYEGPARDAPNLSVIANFRSEGRSAEQAPDLLLWMSDPAGDPPEFGVEAILMKPRSRGSVRLGSADPADPPRIRLPGLGSPDDWMRMREACLRAIEVMGRPELVRACGAEPSGPADDLDELIHRELYSIPHVVGTCAMGRRPEDGAVVDRSGAVHGIETLSVIDASIIPEPPSGFPHLISIMAAELLAERLGATL